MISNDRVLVTEFFNMRIEAAHAAGDIEFALILFRLFTDLDQYLDRGLHLEMH